MSDTEARLENASENTARSDLKPPDLAWAVAEAANLVVSNTDIARASVTIPKAQWHDTSRPPTFQKTSRARPRRRLPPDVLPASKTLSAPGSKRSQPSSKSEPLCAPLCKRAS